MHGSVLSVQQGTMNGRRMQIGKRLLLVDTASRYAKPDVSIEGHWCPSIDTSGLTHVIHMLRLADPSFRPISPRIGPRPVVLQDQSWMLSEAATPSVIGSTN